MILLLHNTSCLLVIYLCSFSLPSVLSNPEFNQKHSRRKIVKVAKSKSKNVTADPSEPSSFANVEFSVASTRRNTPDVKNTTPVKESEMGNHDVVLRERPKVDLTPAALHGSPVQEGSLVCDDNSHIHPGTVMEDELGKQQHQNKAEDKVGGDLPSLGSSTCPQSMTLDLQKPSSEIMTSDDEHFLDFSRIVSISKTEDSLGNIDNPFKKHVSSCELEAGSGIELTTEGEINHRNTELENIMRLLESGVKDTRYAHRQRILHARRAEELRLERQRQLYAQECELSLHGILNRLNPLVGEKMAMGLRQRQQRR